MTTAARGVDVPANGVQRLSEDACWAMLDRHQLGRVALVHFDRPVVYPVNYVTDGRSVVFRSAPGTKLTMSASGAAAAFEVDEADLVFESGASVLVHGHLEAVTDPSEVERLDGLGLRTWAPGRDRYVRVVPERVTGRRLVSIQPADGLAADGG